MKERVGMHQAKTHFSKLVERARLGEEIIVERSGKPVARLVPLEERRPRRAIEARGAMKGGIQMSDDFEQWPADVARALGIVD